MNAVKITRPLKVIRTRIELPYSKSVFNRALILEALTGKKIQIKDEPDSDDARLMRSLLTKSFFPQSDKPIVLDAGNSGTVYRFLTAYLCTQPGTFLLTGSPRMKLRPVFPLVAALRDLGADITYLEKEGYPPLSISGKSGLNSDETRMDSSLSSQFASALLLIAPFLDHGLKLQLAGKLVSEPYIELTVRMLRSIGVKLVRSPSYIQISKYIPKDQLVTIERDWSSAAFWYEIAAISTDAVLDLAKLSIDSLQGDRLLPSLFDPLGVSTTHRNSLVTIRNTAASLQRHIVHSFKDNPDLALPFACSCAVQGINLSLQGISHLRIKESDRISALSEELSKIGCEFHEGKDSLEMDASQVIFNPGMIFNSHDDHRIAMSIAPLALKAGEIIIHNPGVVSKSYPGFWNELTKTGFLVEPV